VWWVWVCVGWVVVLVVVVGVGGCGGGGGGGGGCVSQTHSPFIATVVLFDSSLCFVFFVVCLARILLLFSSCAAITRGWGTRGEAAIERTHDRPSLMQTTACQLTASDVEKPHQLPASLSESGPKLLLAWIQTPTRLLSR